MKRKIFLAAVVCICLLAAFSGTNAFFNDEITVHNLITTGNVGIEVVEKMIDGDGKEVAFPKGGLQGIMPGTKASKIVSVRNTGTGEVWVRVKVTSAVRSGEGKELPVVLDEGIPVIQFEVNEGWVDGKDGYYYYTDPLSAGGETGTLFDEVLFAPQMGNDYQNCQADITLLAQAVQTANNAKDVTEAQGWPKDVTND